MTELICPFEDGDRIDHKIFGFGVVTGNPVAVVSPDLHSAGGVSDAGWTVPVRWDDSQRATMSVMHYALRKISSPESRPFSYWEGKWKPLLQAWLTARREVEVISSSFRPTPDLDDVVKARDKEKSAFEEMQKFLAAERAGQHN